MLSTTAPVVDGVSGVATALDPVTPATLARLHRLAIEGTAGVTSFLLRLQRFGVSLSSGINRRNGSRAARILEVTDRQVRLRFENLLEKHLPQLFLNCELEGRPYFFAVSPVDREEGGIVRAQLPHAIYELERRDLERHRWTNEVDSAVRVELSSSDGRALVAVVADSSYHGLGVLVKEGAGKTAQGSWAVRFVDGERAGEQAHAEIRHSSPAQERSGWIKLGLAISSIAPGPAVAFEPRERILGFDSLTRLGHSASFVGGLVRAASVRAARRLGLPRSSTEGPTVVEYESAPGESLCAIVDTWGDPRNATAVVIPPAWGRTKETLLPLAATIVDTFRSAGQPVTVIRFDGSYRRGESFVPKELRHPGAEYLRFTFSRAVRDIHATVDFLRNSPALSPARIVLVSFSLASVESRRAVATDPSGLIRGWISVVGMADLQSALKTISAGIDYAYGLSCGIRFGHHELVGVIADMDHTGLDALQHKLVFLEDARRDMAKMQVPVTWIHGRHDAWMDLARVRHLMSCGDASNRRVIEVPTGHQLRTSREAFDVFGLVAAEVMRMGLGLRVKPSIPDIAAVDTRAEQERARLPVPEVRLRDFWQRYLVGRDSRFGFQLLTATWAYRHFMESQIAALALRDGDRVLDLGAGTGDLAVQLADAREALRDVTIDALDFVGDALRRAETRLDALASNPGIKISPILADLDLKKARSLPVRSQAYDAVLASLVLSYLPDPKAFLRNAYAALRPGGRLVLSTLRKDADISALHVEGLAELRAGRAREALGEDAAKCIDDLARSFLNDAAKILDLEEQGVFHFWDAPELARMATDAGFRVVKTCSALGDPAQAIVLVGYRA